MSKINNFLFKTRNKIDNTEKNDMQIYIFNEKRPVKQKTGVLKNNANAFIINKFSLFICYINLFNIILKLTAFQ